MKKEGEFEGLPLGNPGRFLAVMGLLLAALVLVLVLNVCIGSVSIPISRVAALLFGFFLRNKLPSSKIYMRLEIFLPGRFDGWFESENKNTFHLHASSKLIASESFAKTHFGIPEEFWLASRILLARGIKIGHSLSDGALLLGAHIKSAITDRIHSSTRS